MFVVDVGEYVSWVRARTHRIIRFANNTLFINEIADPFRKAGFGVVAGAVGEANGSVSIAEERKRKIVFLGECRVLGRTIKANADNADIPRREFVYLVAEPAALRGSTWRVRFGVKPQQYLFPSLGGQREITSCVSLGGKFWSCCSCR